jgi:hypothetical protein
MTPGPTPACRPPAPKPSPERGTAHDQAFGDEIVELGQKGVDALGFVDDHDDDGEVLGKAEDAGGVDVAGGAVALQALRSMPVWFFSSGPLVDDEQSPHIPPVGQVRRLMRRVGARGHATFGGRLVANPPVLAAGFVPDPWLGDWRNPDEVARWVAGIVIQLTTTNARIASPLA